MGQIPLPSSASTQTRSHTTGKKAGKVVRTGKAVVSKDGKVMTFTTKGTNAQGQPTNNVTVYEKQ